jgi:peroxiredoxin
MKSGLPSILFGALVGAIIVLPALAALQVGESAADFTAQASLAGQPFTFSLKAALSKGPVVVYFYPSAFTGGCNLEAHTFSEDSEAFAAAGASIIGVSEDSITRLNAFSADPQYCAGKFPVASDPDGKIAKSYDVAVREASSGRKDTRGVEIDHGFAERTTFVITPDGKIAATLGGLAPGDHVEKALAVVRGLKG